MGMAEGENGCWTQVTKDAGRVESLKFNLNGECIIFTANFPADNRVITTHMKLWTLEWEKLCIAKTGKGEA